MVIKGKAQSVERQALILMPSAGEFEDIFNFVLTPIFKEEGFRCRRLDGSPRAGDVLKALINEVIRADIVLADISAVTPNVMFELGMLYTLHTRVILIAQEGGRVPFDIQNQRVILYDIGALPKFSSILRDEIKRIMNVEIGPALSRRLVADSLVPRESYEKLQSEVRYLRKELEVRSALLGRNSSSPDLSNLLSEFRSTFNEWLAGSIMPLNDEVTRLKIDLEHSRQENQALQACQAELSRLKTMTLVNPHWKGRDLTVESQSCFLIMPFREPWSDDVSWLVHEIVESTGFNCIRADEKDGRVIMDDIWEGICKAAVVIADLTAKNPNVTYEVGLADVLGKNVILLSQTPNDVPFDFLGLRLVLYENSIRGTSKLRDDLTKRLQAVNKAMQITDETSSANTPDAPRRATFNSTGGGAKSL